MAHPLLASFLIGGGLLTNVGTAAALAAQTGTDLAPILSGSGAAAAVGGLAYVVKKFAAGELVAFPLASVTQASIERERKLQELIEQSREREDALRLLLMERRG